MKRKELKEKMIKTIGNYEVYNGFAITHLLRRLNDIFEDKIMDFKSIVEKELKWSSNKMT